MESVKKNGEIEYVKVKVLADYKEKLKGYIHWVSEAHSVGAIIRLYNYMFDIAEVPNDEWDKHINPDSLIEMRNGKIWKNIENAKEFDRF